MRIAQNSSFRSNRIFCVCSRAFRAIVPLRNIAALALAGALLSAGVIDAVRAGSFLGDYRAFSCAGSAVLHGENPYAASTLYPCESTLAPLPVYRARDGVALPAPLPGYALAAFALFALLPPGGGALLWMLLLALAIYVAVRSLDGLEIPMYLSACAFAFPIAAVSLPFGEVVPIALAACCAAGAALRRRRFNQATAWMMLSMIEPHVGFAIAVAFFVLPQTRVRALIGGLVLALGHLLVLRDAAASYFVHVLPQLALAELPRTSQYSLSWVVAQLGMPANAALALGSVSYGCGLLAASVVTWLLVRRFGALELFALIPPAFAVVGGSFMHLAQSAFAIPAALVLRRYAPPRMQGALTVAVLVLAIPWNVVSETPWLLGFVPLVLAVLAVWLLDATAIVALAVALLGTLGGGALLVLRVRAVYARAVTVPHLDPALAVANWANWIAKNDSASGAGIWVPKLPTWLALLCVVAAACTLSYEKYRVSVPSKSSPPLAGT
jgi:hypothetical protein